MQCSGCGFENIPGSEKCAICATSLSSDRGGESVLPPRAKDRSPWERLTWRFRESRATEAVNAALSRVPSS